MKPTEYYYRFYSNVFNSVKDLNLSDGIIVRKLYFVSCCIDFISNRLPYVNCDYIRSMFENLSHVFFCLTFILYQFHVVLKTLLINY